MCESDAKSRKVELFVHLVTAINSKSSPALNVALEAGFPFKHYKSITGAGFISQRFQNLLIRFTRRLIIRHVALRGRQEASESANESFGRKAVT